MTTRWAVATAPQVNVTVKLEDLEAGRGDEFADGVVLDPSGQTFTSEAPIRHPRPPPELFVGSG
ncbi:hypothetical protein BH20ACT1_BH20ACT1_13420 [soil metagenome]